MIVGPSALPLSVGAETRCGWIGVAMRAQPYRTERFTFEGHDLVYDVYGARPVLRVSSSVARRVPATRFGPLNSALHAVALTPEVVAAVMHGVLVRPVAPTQEQRARIVAPALRRPPGADARWRRR